MRLCVRYRFDFEEFEKGGEEEGGSEKNRLARKLNWRERRVNIGDEPTVHVQTVGRQINFGRQPVDVKTGVDG